ncbi:hypothetical protein ACFONN_08120 [Dyella humi]
MSQTIRPAAVCFICGQVTAIDASAADVPIVAVSPIVPDGIVQT